MEDSISLPVYRHESLSDPELQIRLLEVLEGDFGQRVVCRLSTWELKDAPPYYAMSYTWGANSGRKTAITLDGRELMVTENCGYMLQQAYAATSGQHIWVDCVCINQSDLDEKSSQVGLMGEIYNSAVHVLACVGPHANGSEDFFHQLKSMKGLLRSIYSKIRPDRVHPGSWAIQCPILDHRWLSIRCFASSKLLSRRRMLQAFQAFLRREYFGRVWVLQEQYMARSLSYCCGTAIQPCEDILAFSMLAELFDHDLWKKSPHFTVQSALVPRGPLKYAWYLHAFADDFSTGLGQRGCLALASSMSRPKRLPDVLTAMESYSCSMPRDKLFAIINIVDWQDGEVPVPDYKQDIISLATDTLERSLMTEDREVDCFGKSDFVWNLLNLSAEQEPVREAIATRRRANSWSSPVSEDSYVRRFPDHRWTGAIIKSFSSVVSVVKAGDAHNLYIREGRQESQAAVELLDHTGTLHAYAPPDTNIGDWFLERVRALDTKDVHMWQYKVQLIVRVGMDDRYELMGTALGSRTSSYRTMRIDWGSPRETMDFCVRWAAEDLLLLARHRSSDGHTHNRVPTEQMVDAATVRICGLSGQSYAVISKRNEY